MFRCPALVVCLVSMGALAAQEAPLARLELAQDLPVFSVHASEVAAISEESLAYRNLGDVHLVAFRVRLAGEGAKQLHLENFRLPSGARVLIYGAEGKVAGPYRGAGPTQSGEFWTQPLEGEVLTIELQSDEPIASLPFDIAGYSLAESAPDLGDAAPADGEKRLGLFRGVPVEYRVVDGMAVFEGDILLGRAEEIEPYRGDKALDRQSVYISGSFYRWPSGVVPYVIDATVPNQSRITTAIDHWNAQLSGSVRLIPRTTESVYARFVRPASAGTCSSYVGRIGQAGQAINIGDNCSTGNTIHEIGHALGLFHEQTRTDRDTYVRINTQNISPSAVGNFTVAANSINPGPYDYSSIMHYGAYAFSINGLPTIETIPAGIAIGQRSALSSGDVAGVRAMYPNGGTTPPSTVNVTLASNPAGRTLVADGATVVAPNVKAWQPGTVHTISASDTATADTQYAFLRWSDGGARTHNITTPTTAATLTATYQTLFRVQTSAVPTTGGALNVQPASATGFYASGTSLTLAANPAANYCFTGWGGTIPVTAPNVTLLVNRPYAIAANFQVGAISVPASVSVARTQNTYSLSVSATSGCVWTASSNVSWIVVNTRTGTSSGVLSVTVRANNSSAARSGLIIVNGKTITVTQAGR